MSRWYGSWAGNELGVREDPTRCAAEVYPNERGPIPHQCRRKRRAGFLTCKQHERETRFPKDETAEETKERVDAARAWKSRNRV